MWWERQRERTKNTVLFFAENNTSPNLFKVKSFNAIWRYNMHVCWMGVLLDGYGCVSWWQMGNEQIWITVFWHGRTEGHASRTDTKDRESEFQSSPPPASQPTSQPANGPAKSFDLVARCNPSVYYSIRRTAWRASMTAKSTAAFWVDLREA